MASYQNIHTSITMQKYAHWDTIFQPTMSWGKIQKAL